MKSTDLMRFIYCQKDYVTPSTLNKTIDLINSMEIKILKYHRNAINALFFLMLNQSSNFKSVFSNTDFEYLFISLLYTTSEPFPDLMFSLFYADVRFRQVKNT